MYWISPVCINLIYCKSLKLNACNLHLALCNSSFISNISHPCDLLTRYISFLQICRSNRSNSPHQFSIFSLVLSCLDLFCLFCLFFFFFKYFFCKFLDKDMQILGKSGVLYLQGRDFWFSACLL
jgi:hypothetical protein